MIVLKWQEELLAWYSNVADAEFAMIGGIDKGKAHPDIIEPIGKSAGLRKFLQIYRQPVFAFFCSKLRQAIGCAIPEFGSIRNPVISIYVVQLLSIPLHVDAGRPIGIRSAAKCDVQFFPFVRPGRKTRAMTEPYLARNGRHRIIWSWLGPDRSGRTSFVDGYQRFAKACVGISIKCVGRFQPGIGMVEDCAKTTECPGMLKLLQVG